MASHADSPWSLGLTTGEEDMLYSLKRFLKILIEHKADPNQYLIKKYGA